MSIRFINDTATIITTMLKGEIGDRKIDAYTKLDDSVMGKLWLYDTAAYNHFSISEIVEEIAKSVGMKDHTDQMTLFGEMKNGALVAYWSRPTNYKKMSFRKFIFPTDLLVALQKKINEKYESYV